ncbi:matrixin family metalloprotease [Paenibacillus terrae]|uniref:Peptidase metallopeptidase domain-containing protein n=1 Tax=Paenibacillus terrae TaxID=159743 RepID=A0A0D7WTR0_9BACL|nr:matrixin family metalloprotease [Paenibacillus terrae]KJD42566.1 hypothetical protein QD47_27515 [Paenibacillus terrae]
MKITKTVKVPSNIGLTKSDTGESVTELQNLLQKFGYLQLTPKREDEYAELRNEIASPKAEKGVFDDATEEGLKNYQKFNGLPQTGQLDESTVKQMGIPRCGFPDRRVGFVEFNEHGNRWPNTNLTYRIENFTIDLTEEQVRSAIASAFKLWSDVTPLTFTEVDNNSNADIKIKFVVGAHGDHNDEPFDGIGHVLAHAFFPPPNLGDLAGDAHFDDSETWSVNLPVSAGIDLVTVAAHEFGHSLGLDHSNVRGSLMFASYTGEHRFLHQDDIQGIQSIYGS